MITRWKDDSLYLLATPIVAALVQIESLAFATSHQADSGRMGSFATLLFFGSFLLPLVSIPASAFSVRRFRARRQRGLSFIACILNGVYGIALILGILILVLPILGYAKR